MAQRAPPTHQQGSTTGHRICPKSSQYHQFKFSPKVMRRYFHVGSSIQEPREHLNSPLDRTVGLLASSGDPDTLVPPLTVPLGSAVSLRQTNTPTKLHETRLPWLLCASVLGLMSHPLCEGRIAHFGSVSDVSSRTVTGFLLHYLSDASGCIQVPTSCSWASGMGDHIRSLSFLVPY